MSINQDFLRHLRVTGNSYPVHDCGNVQTVKCNSVNIEVLIITTLVRCAANFTVV